MNLFYTALNALYYGGRYVLMLLLLLGSVSIFSVPSFARQIQSSREIYVTEESIHEAYVEARLTPREYNALLELYRCPVDINGYELIRLTAIPGVDEAQVEYIRRYRDTHGEFSHPDSLALIIGIDDDLIIPFTEVRNQVLPVVGTLRFQVSQKRGLNNRAQKRISAGLRLRNKFIFGVRAADTGAPDAEVYSFSVEYRQKRIVRSVVAGNYRAAFGHTLVMGGPHDAGGNGEYDGAADPSKTGEYLSGVRADFAIGQWHATVLQCSRDLLKYIRFGDADTSMSDMCGAGRLEYRHHQGQRVGITGLAAEVRHRTGVTEYRVGGMDFLYRYKHLSLLGEVALNEVASAGALVGVVWKKNNFTSRMVYRDYATHFINPYSRSFASSDGDDNDSDERGLLVRSDMQLRGSRKIWGVFNTWQTPSTGVWHRYDRLGYRMWYGNQHRFGCGVLFRADNLQYPQYGSMTWWFHNDLVYKVMPGLETMVHYRITRDVLEAYKGGYMWLRTSKIFTNGLGFSVRVKFVDNNFTQASDAYVRFECTENMRVHHFVQVHASGLITLYEDEREAMMQVMVRCVYRME